MSPALYLLSYIAKEPPLGEPRLADYETAVLPIFTREAKADARPIEVRTVGVEPTLSVWKTDTPARRV